MHVGKYTVRPMDPLGKWCYRILLTTGYEARSFVAGYAARRC